MVKKINKGLRDFYIKLCQIFNKFNLKTIFLVTLTIVLVIWTLRLVQVHFHGYELDYVGHSYYHSDDTAQANILWQWQNGYRGGARVGDDNWIIKYPLYIFTNNLPIQPIQKLFLNSLITLYITALLMMLAIYGFVKLLINNKQKQKLAIVLAGLSFTVVGQETFGVIKMSNSRNIELGIFMLLMVALLAYELKPKLFKSKKSLKLAGLLLVVGLLCANDPMFIYLGLVPLAIAVVVQYFFANFSPKNTAKYIFFIFGGAFLAIIFKKLIVILLPLSFLHHQGKLDSTQAIFKKAPELASSILNILGIDFLGAVQQQSKAVMLTVGLLLPIIIFAVWAVFYKSLKNKLKGSTTINYIAMLWLWIPAVYSFSTLSDPPQATVRYLILLIALLPTSIVVLINITNKPRQLVGLTILIVCTVLLTTVSSARAVTKHQTPNTRELNIISILNDQNLSKGYGAVWDSGIISYLSNQTINVVTVLCNDNHDLYTYDLFSNKDYVAKQRSKSFYIYNSKDSYVSKCTPEALTPQLGKPSKVIPVGDEYSSIVVYDYDIYKTLMSTP